MYSAISCHLETLSTSAEDSLTTCPGFMLWYLEVKIHYLTTKTF